MNVWKISPGKGGFLWVQQRERECIAVRWDDIGNLNKYRTEEEIRKKFKKEYPNANPRQLILFYKGINKGDKVVASAGKFLFGLGTVVGNYKYNDGLEYKNSYPVSWEITFWEPLDVRELSITDELKKKLLQNKTIFPLKEVDWETLYKVAYMSENPFKNLTNWKGMLKAPTKEQEVIILFSKLLEPLNMKIETIGTRCPDALIWIKNKKGKPVEKAVEFEINSSDFKNHKHSPDDCDMIICWKDKDDWKNRPKDLKVIELRSELIKVL